MKKIKIDITSLHKYEDDNLEKIEQKNLEFIIKDNKYISKDMHISIDNNIIEVVKGSDIYYNKIYELNKKRKSILKLNSNEIITYIFTTKIKKVNSTYMIYASEYTENDEKISDILLNIKIKGE